MNCCMIILQIPQEAMIANWTLGGLLFLLVVLWVGSQLTGRMGFIGCCPRRRCSGPSKGTQTDGISLERLVDAVELGMTTVEAEQERLEAECAKLTKWADDLEDYQRLHGIELSSPRLEMLTPTTDSITRDGTQETSDTRLTQVTQDSHATQKTPSRDVTVIMDDIQEIERNQETRPEVVISSSIQRVRDQALVNSHILYMLLFLFALLTSMHKCHCVLLLYLFSLCRCAMLWPKLMGKSF